MTIDNTTRQQLIAEGWTPPLEHLEAHRELLDAFYGGRRDAFRASKDLDQHDLKNIAGIAAVLSHLGVEWPRP